MAARAAYTGGGGRHRRCSAGRRRGNRITKMIHTEKYHLTPCTSLLGLGDGALAPGLGDPAGQVPNGLWLTSFLHVSASRSLFSRERCSLLPPSEQQTWSVGMMRLSRRGNGSCCCRRRCWPAWPWPSCSLPGLFLPDCPSLASLSRRHILLHSIRSNPRILIRFINQLCCVVVQTLYRAPGKSVYVVARNFILLLLNFSAWPCLAVA